MNELFEKISQEGPSLIFGVCFLEAIGFPFPAAVALIAGGALAASGMLQPGPVLVSSLGAFILGDLLLYAMGRFTGWWLLGLLCRLSANPESCMLTAARQFYKRGRTVLLFAKFIPGMNTMGPPLAGSMRMRFLDFAGLDMAGIMLYAGAYLTLGYVCSDLLAVVFEGLGAASRVARVVVTGAILGFIGNRLWHAWKSREYRNVPKVNVSDVAGELDSEDSLVLDVRSHGYYESNTQRIKGSQRLEPNALPEAMKDLPEGKKIYLYCT